jgi:hypothetical protein
MVDFQFGMQKQLDALAAYDEYLAAKREGSPERVREARDRAYRAHIEFVSVRLDDGQA